MSRIITQIPDNAKTLFKMILLGVTNNCAFQFCGSFVGQGITIICELGMSWFHVCDRWDNPILTVSTKFGVRPRPKIV